MVRYNQNKGKGFRKAEVKVTTMLAYVRPTTTIQEIKDEISDVEYVLNVEKNLSKESRDALHEHLDYLNSFLPVERW